MIKYDTITGEMEKKHKEDLKLMTSDADKDQLLEDFKNQKGKMARAHEEEVKAMKEKHSEEKQSMKKEHNEHKERPKIAMEHLQRKMVGMETDYEMHKGKLQTEILALKSDHSEALRKQREALELEAHKTAMQTEQKHQKHLDECLKELREHNVKFMNKPTRESSFLVL